MKIKREIQAEHDAAFIGPTDCQDSDASTAKEKKEKEQVGNYWGRMINHNKLTLMISRPLWAVGRTSCMVS